MILSIYGAGLPAYKDDAFVPGFREVEVEYQLARRKNQKEEATEHDQSQSQGS
jgi:hypothetical protein